MSVEADLSAGINRMLAAGHLEERKSGALRLTAAGRVALDEAADEWEAEHGQQDATAGA